MQNGIYEVDDITFSVSGTEHNPIHFVAPSGNVIIQGINTDSTENNFWVTGKYLVFKDFTVKNFGNGVHIQRHGDNSEAPNNILVENIKSYDNFYSGIVVDGGFQDDSYGYSLASDLEKPSNITIKDCDASGSKGLNEYGTHGDGINIRGGVGEGNRIIGCRSFNNLDDGIDLWQAASSVEVYNTWSYNNGKIVGENVFGDGAGFKLGEDLDGHDGIHYISHCLAWENLGFGFTDSEAEKMRMLKYNTAFDNGREGFKAEDHDEFFYNIAFSNEPQNIDIYGYATAEIDNSWNDNITIVEQDLIRTQSAYDIAKGARKGNGMLPDTDYLKFINVNHTYVNTGYWAKH